jgi:sulfur carrier protein
MKIILNGEPRLLSQPNSLADVLNECGYDHTLPFAVAVNHVFIPRQDYSNTLLNEDDEVEIVMPMQGG